MKPKKIWEFTDEDLNKFILGKQNEVLKEKKTELLREFNQIDSDRICGLAYSKKEQVDIDRIREFVKKKVEEIMK